MSGWQAGLKADPTEWLLGEDDPAVRRATLVGLLGRPEDDPDVAEARRRLMAEGPVARILARQNAGGYWGKPESFYLSAKYRGTVWSLLLLAELGADGADPRVRAACEFMLQHSQDLLSGGFAIREGPEGGGEHASVSPCLTGNMAWALSRLGLGEDPRVQHAVEWIATYQRFDDGESRAPKDWPYQTDMCWGRHSCTNGVVKGLKALAEVPPGRRSPAVRRTIEQGAEYLLRHHLYKRSHDLSQVAKGEWLRFGFPLMWRTDALEMAGILVRLGYRDERLRDAVGLILAKQGGQGRWLLEESWNGRMLVTVERAGEPSKGVTLQVLQVLRAFQS